MKTWCAVGGAILLAMTVSPAEAARRALVIGNANYQHLARLTNPTPDARLMARLFKDGGFAVERYEELSKRDMRNVLRRFAQKVRAGDDVVFYFSGHGFAVDGANYLMGKDFDARDEAEAKDNALKVSEIVQRLSANQPRAQIIILDACRNNPFKRAYQKNMKAMGFLPQESLTGTFFAFATALGATAADGSGNKGGPFARTMDRVFRAHPGLDVALAFRKVRQSMRRSIGQEPWTQSSLNDMQWAFLPGLRPLPPIVLPGRPLARPAASSAPPVPKKKWTVDVSIPFNAKLTQLAFTCGESRFFPKKVTRAHRHHHKRWTGAVLGNPIDAVKILSVPVENLPADITCHLGYAESMKSYAPLFGLPDLRVRVHESSRLEKQVRKDDVRFSVRFVARPR